MGKRSVGPKKEAAVLHPPQKLETYVLVHPGLEPHEGDGFVIITAASDQGMVDIHDRRPLVLSPELAREWTTPSIDHARAAEITRECCTPDDEFEWYKVGKAVGNVRNQGQDLIRPDSDAA